MASSIVEKLANSMDLDKFEVLNNKYFIYFKNLILEKIIELVYDSEIKVKVAALKLVFKIFEKLHP